MGLLVSKSERDELLEKAAYIAARETFNNLRVSRYLEDFDIIEGLRDAIWDAVLEADIEVSFVEIEDATRLALKRLQGR